MSVFIDGHHVLQVVALGAELRVFCDAPAVCLHEYFLILRLESLVGLMHNASRDLAFEALGRVMRVALAIEVLRCDARDEARVSWNALVADVVRRSIHPSARRLAHIAAHRYFLRTFVRAINA